MYYILNETNQIIAADDSLLNLCGVAHINELSSSVARGDTTFDFMSDVNISITTGGEEETYNISKTSLSSMLGTLTLVNLSIEDASAESLSTLLDSEADIEDESSDLIDSIINEEKSQDSEDILLDEEVEEVEEEITFGDHLTLDDDVMDLKNDTPKEEQLEETGDNILDDSEIFDLVSDDIIEDAQNDAVETLETTDLETATEEAPLALGLDDDLFLDTEKVEDAAEININSEEISQKIGISTDDYNGFLNDFIDTSLGLEKDLQSNDEETRSSAIGTLSHLSDVLHLPVIGDIISNIAEANSDNQREVIESFYATLSRITTAAPTDENIEIEKTLDISEDIPEIIEEEKLELFDEPETLKEPMIQEEVKPRKSTSSESFGTISLEGVKSKHFDFQLEEAASDLSLPVELIEEFVHDFIDQAHIETKKMLEAYEDGDLDAIQKIGHLLKGASSNLRINPLSDTLYKIQFCEDSSQLEALIKDYWAHLLSFENQINVISN